MIFKAVQLSNYAKNPDTKVKAFLIYGTNEGLQRETVKKVAQAVCPDLKDAFRVAEINAEGLAADLGRLYGEFNGQSLMGGRRVIIVNGAGNELSKPVRKMLDESQKSENLLILVGVASLNKKASLVKLAEDSEDMVAVPCYEDRNEDINTVLKTMGLTFEPQALQMLYARLSGDRLVNMGELEKLSVYMGNAKTVTPEIIKQIISDAADSDVDDIYYAALAGNRDEALDKYILFLNKGNDPISLLRPLIYHIMRLLSCVAMMEKGETADRAMGKLTPPVFKMKIDAFKYHLSLWGRGKLLHTLELLYEAEKDCKTTNMPAKEIVGMLLLRLSGAAKK